MSDKGKGKAKAQSEPKEPLRGEAAWKAMKQGVAERNERAYARGRAERADAAAAAWERRRAAERADKPPASKRP